MLTILDLRERKAELELRLAYAKSTEAKSTEVYLSKELEIIELAIIGVRRSELNND